MTVEVYTKDLCGYCDAAKELLDHMRVPYQTYKIGTDITRDQLLEIAPNAKTATATTISTAKTPTTAGIVHCKNRGFPVSHITCM